MVVLPTWSQQSPVQRIPIRISAYDQLRHYNPPTNHSTYIRPAPKYAHNCSLLSLPMPSAFEFVVAGPSGPAAEDRMRIRSRCVQGRNKREGSRRSLREVKRRGPKKTTTALVGRVPPPAPADVSLPLAEYVDAQSRETLYKGNCIPSYCICCLTSCRSLHIQNPRICHVSPQKLCRLHRC